MNEKYIDYKYIELNINKTSELKNRAVYIKSKRRQGCHSCIINKVNNFKIFRIFNEKCNFSFLWILLSTVTLIWVGFSGVRFELGGGGVGGGPQYRRFTPLSFFQFDSLNMQNILALLVWKMVWDLIMVFQLVSNEFKALWFKVASKGSNYILVSFLVLVTTN